jgi:hypothetical protein
MTLKEQFIDAFKSGKRFDIQNAEVIADDFAIDFADWIRVCKLKGRGYDFDNIEELLKTYKEEKGL